ncbi:MAG: hypothetical protein P9L95_00175 [Candidatus Tenebribacter mawsonii]|nr:hypothetical protein [Candidatus Tenebribacter mawsonii]
MKKNSIIFMMIIVLMYLITPIFAQNYQEEFTEIIETYSGDGEKAVHEALTEYFNALSDEVIADAIVDISELGDENLSVELILFTNNRFDDEGVFRNRIVQKVALGTSPDQFRIAAIDFLKDKYTYTETDDIERVTYENVLYNLATDTNMSISLRSYAASEIGKTLDLATNKTRIQTLLINTEPEIVNAAANAAKKYILSPDLSQDLDTWTNILINVLNQASDKNQVKSVIYSLAYTETNAAKNYLLTLFNQSVSLNRELTYTLISAISYFADSEIMKQFFISTNQNILYNTYESELVLKNVVLNNMDLLEELVNNNDTDSKITFLKSLRLLRTTTNEDFILSAIELLDDADEYVVLEAVKALHFILPHEEEEVVFDNLRNRNQSIDVNNLINTYIGIQ